MKYIPILFSTLMVQALLAGRKTMTRRVVKGIEITENEGNFNFQSKKAWGQNVSKENLTDTFLGFGSECPYGKVGDVLWVRESYCPKYFDDGKHGFKADWNKTAAEYVTEPKWKPSLFMPKEACRLFLEITNIKVERLGDISEEDAISEGIEVAYYKNEVIKFDGRTCYKLKNNEVTDSPIQVFKFLWQSINGADSWNKNPWVWVIEFKQIEKPNNF